MRVFLSFARNDAKLAAQLLEALRRRNIETWSALDVAPGEDWRRLVDQESAKADGFLFLVGDGGSVDQRLRAEWRALLRNDSESKKALIPIVKLHGSSPDMIPAFLRNRQVLYTTDFDD